MKQINKIIIWILLLIFLLIAFFISIGNKKNITITPNKKNINNKNIQVHKKMILKKPNKKIFYKNLCKFQRTLRQYKLNTYYKRIKIFLNEKSNKQYIKMYGKDLYNNIDIEYMCNSLRHQDRKITINLVKYFLTWLGNCNKLKLKNLLYWFVMNGKCLNPNYKECIKIIINNYISQNWKKIFEKFLYLKTEK